MIHPDSVLDISQIRKNLQQIFIEVIGEDLHSVPDNIPILDLGIRSLALVEGMRRVYDQFGVLISIRRVIEGQVTLDGLALYVEQELNVQRTRASEPPSALRQWKIEREIPLAPSQQHMGFLSRYSNEAAAAFNESLLVHLDGILDGPALQTAIETVSNRYESLRTSLNREHDTLDIGTGEPLELIVSSTSAALMQQRLAEIVSRPFEPGNRLFRAELLRLSEAEHVLVLVGHSLIIEHQALVIVLEDVAALYRVFACDKAAGAAPAVLQWTDYLAMGDTTQAKESQLSAAAYWKDVFASGVPRLELPADHPRPPVKRYGGARLEIPLEPGLEARLRSWAGAEKINPDAILISAYTAFLHRLSDQNGLVVGVESEPIYLDTGLKALASTRNMLPIRINFDPARSFKDHVHAQSDLLAKANAYRHLSLSELIQLLHLSRDQSRSAIFSAAFRSWTTGIAPKFETLDTTYLIPPSAGARYDIELIVVSTETGTHLVCDYSTELFDADTISRWLHGVLAWLSSGLEDASLSCGSLPILQAEELQKQLFDWNKTEKTFSREQTVLDRIVKQAHVRGEQPAIRFGTTSLSYRQLIEQVENIAGTLHTQGVGRGDRVGILLKRSLDLIPAMLAVWRVGAIYVPMDTAFPKQRLAYMMDNASVQTVITNQELTPLVDKEARVNLISVEDVSPELASAIKKISPALGSDSAIIFFTSGSTGKPKGVEIRHSALLNSLQATREYLEFTPQSSMLALTTISFDISTNELFMPLMGGGGVDLGEDGLIADGFQLVERLNILKPSHVQATASVWKTVLTAGWQGDKNVCLVSTGEALSRDLTERLLEKCRVLWNLYGPTETTVFSSAYRVETAPGKPMRIGRPFPNTQMYILDRRLQPLPTGAIGELYIAGEGLARGYWQKPELTEQRFIPNPFRAGERMYDTGDLARYLPDGNIICLGRLDDQVKIHGVRVELGEVEGAIRSVAGVHDAIVSSWKDPGGETQLVGHVIATGDGALTASQLRAQLRAQLPEVMVPPTILFSTAFPMTANGKVHRAVLPSPNEVQQAPMQPTEPPSSPTEKLLAGAWAKVLGIDVGLIGRDSDFIDLGGHSLLMTPLMLEVRKLFQISFRLREFFAASTIQKFATMIDQSRQAIDGSKSRPRSATTRNPKWARERMGFLQREAQLPLYIAPSRGLSFQPTQEIRTLFLTGATGFLGCYITAEILETTRANLYCLVRPVRGENAKQRIEKQLRRYDLWRDDEVWQQAWNNRLHAVEGDVTLPRMGIPDATYETLARDVDAILHGAAHVNFIYPYEALRATNLLGLHEIIQFAFHSRIKPVHHISTAAIWPMGAQFTYYEKDPIDHGGVLNLGYDEAKWVGERCLLNAAERGLPVVRYRPGEVGGDSLTGRCVIDHFLIASTKGFLQFGAFPALDIQVDVTPVDYVAKAIVYLLFQRNPLGRAFHLTNPHRRHMREALTFLRSLGYQFEELPFEDLRDRLVDSRNFSNNALFAYQATLEEMDNVSMQLPTYDTRQTQRELEGSGIVCPPADERLFETYLNYLQGIGFIPKPELLHVRA